VRSESVRRRERNPSGWAWTTVAVSTKTIEQQAIGFHAGGNEDESPTLFPPPDPEQRYVISEPATDGPSERAKHRQALKPAARLRYSIAHAPLASMHDLHGSQRAARIKNLEGGHETERSKRTPTQPSDAHIPSRAATWRRISSALSCPRPCSALIEPPKRRDAVVDDAVDRRVGRGMSLHTRPSVGDTL